MDAVKLGRAHSNVNTQKTRRDSGSAYTRVRERKTVLKDTLQGWYYLRFSRETLTAGDLLFSAKFPVQVF